ncbi:carbamoyltransferase HypF [Nocardioides hungaricus]
MSHRVAAPAREPGAARIRRRYVVRGVVQGVGFRPFVYVAATDLGLTGTVANGSDGVTVEVEGPAAAVEELGRRLSDAAPPLAAVAAVEAEDLPLRGGTGFTIAASSSAGRARTLASPDVATCADCLRELADPGDRRHRHPFVTCTNCGPRFTIVTGLPYDRARTTMADFEMCPACRREYDDPADRRFHAQPIGCHDCGPVLELVGPEAGPARGEDAVRAARAALAAGRIVAVKGLGGYHLVCDAADEAAVARLRRRKARGPKPFALMVPDLATARTLGHVDAATAAALTGPQRPIVLLDRRRDAPVAPSVAPGSPDLGVMLPYTPVHTLLLGLPGDEPGPRLLVMTSGNLGGEPIVTDDDAALDVLSGLADLWLRHDRRIEQPCDDSVVRVVDGVETAIRRSRGWAPLPVALPRSVEPVLAVGADLKSTCCVAEGRYAWLSQHVGDMDDLATLAAFDRAQERLRLLTGVRPWSLVVDAHPGYRSTGWAHRHARAAGLPVVAVQHHHAHVAAVLAEHGVDAARQVIGVAFDGTGYGAPGPDGHAASWGGEFLVADYGGFRRIAHLAEVGQPGGDASVARPYRMALAHLAAAGVEWAADLPCVAACPEAERGVLRHQLRTGLGTTPTSSMGRLFDAVSSLLGACQLVEYEGQAAVELEALARGHDASAGYRFEAGPGPVDAAPVIRAVVADLRDGAELVEIAARFHRGVAELVRDVCVAERAASGIETVALGGGVFQNVVLLRAARRLLDAAGFEVLAAERLPANDGGLALGQAMIAAHGGGAACV